MEQTKDTITAAIKRRLERAGFESKRNPADYATILDSFSDALTTKGRGIVLSGSVGCGKTFAMRSIIRKSNIVECFDSQQLQRLTMADQPHDRIELIHCGCDLILDDIGSDGIINDFGTRCDIVSNFVTKWHSYVTSRSHIDGIQTARLFITTNLDEDALLARYKIRVMSRLAEICDFVRLSGKSNRRMWKKYGANNETSEGGQ